MDEGLKQRIIGALVLVVAAVIFLPMLLSGQDETVQVEVEVPATPVPDDTDIVAALPPTLPEPAPVPEIPPPALEDTAPPATAVLSEPAEPLASEPVVAPPPPPAAEPEPPASVPAAGGWVIQLASFSSAENADSFRKTLADQGYNAYTRSAQSGGKTIVRVYVGPLASRDGATRVRDELERRHKSKGLVVAHDASTGAR